MAVIWSSLSSPKPVYLPWSLSLCHLPHRETQLWALSEALVPFVLNTWKRKLNWPQ